MPNSKIEVCTRLLVVFKKDATRLQDWKGCYKVFNDPDVFPRPATIGPVLAT